VLRAQSRWVISRAAWGLLAVLGGAASTLFAPAGCTDSYGDPANDTPWVHVFDTPNQPQSSDLGVLLEVQAFGGNFVSLRVEDGNLSLLLTPDGGIASTAACIPVTQEGVVHFQVVPAQNEAILFADLYQVDTSQGTTFSVSNFCATTMQPVATAIIAVEHAENNAPSDGGTSSDSEAGTQGEGGMEPGLDAAAEGGDAALEAGGAVPEGGDAESAPDALGDAEVADGAVDATTLDASGTEQ
jgi:hypothetical protein